MRHRDRNWWGGPCVPTPVQLHHFLSPGLFQRCRISTVGKNETRTLLQHIPSQHHVHVHNLNQMIGLKDLVMLPVHVSLPPIHSYLAVGGLV